MTPSPLLAHSTLHHQLLQLATALTTQLEALAQQTPPHQLLTRCEDFLLGHGRQFLRDSLAATLQHQIDTAEKKGGLPAPVLADTPAGPRVRGRANSAAASAPSA